MANVRTDDMVDEIEQIREHLAETIDALIERASPRTIARRGLAEVKATFVEPDGAPRWPIIGKVAGGAVAVVALAVAVRRMIR